MSSTTVDNVQIDTHSHLIPGVDDGCADVEESIACARAMVEAGYTHSFCTPHIWSSLPGNTVAEVVRRTAALQAALDAAGVPLKLYPGGELNLSNEIDRMDKSAIPTYGMAGKYAIGDLWCDDWPACATDRIAWLTDQGITFILAHPERMKAIQDRPGILDGLQKRGVLLQGNLQMFGEPETHPARRLAEHLLKEGRYFMVGSDLHKLATLPVRLEGLRRVRELAGEEYFARLTHENPGKLIP